MIYDKSNDKISSFARVVKLVDTRDLKSLDLMVVPVRFRLWAPI